MASLSLLLVATSCFEQIVHLVGTQNDIGMTSVVKKMLQLQFLLCML